MKFRSIFYGSGKAGNIVGYKGKSGEYLMRSYVPHVHDAQSLEQLKQRARITTLTRGLSVFMPYVSLNYLKNYKRTAWANLLKLNYKNVIGEYPNYILKYSDVILSQGTVSNIFKMYVGGVGNRIDLKWLDYTGLCDAKEDDFLTLVCLNSDNGELLLDNECTTRVKKHYTMYVPDNWIGSSIHCYYITSRSYVEHSPSGYVSFTIN